MLVLVQSYGASGKDVRGPNGNKNYTEVSNYLLSEVEANNNPKDIVINTDAIESIKFVPLYKDSGRLLYLTMRSGETFLVANTGKIKELRENEYVS